MNRLELLAGAMAIAAAMLAVVYEATSAEILSTSQLSHVTAAGKPVNGNAGPYVQTPVKAPNVVKNPKGGAVVVNPKGGAVVKGKK